MTSVSKPLTHSIYAQWNAPATVHAFSTTRRGGVSQPPFDQLNLGQNAGDLAEDVLQNRHILRQSLPSEPCWLRQVHGAHVSTPASRKYQSTDSDGQPWVADASVTNIPNEVLAVLTADCMPVLFASVDGRVIGAAHAGWRGLSLGVLENTVQAMRALSAGLEPHDLMAWMGPAIGPSAFEVGQDVYDAFVYPDNSLLATQKAFAPIASKPGKFYADLYQLAKVRLEAMGLMRVSGGGFCTHHDPERFYSYRRDGLTGRFASCIWISA